MNGCKEERLLVFCYDMLRMGSEGRDIVVKGCDTRMES